MVGAARLELATPRSQSECATNCATPRHNLLRKQESVTPYITYTKIYSNFLVYATFYSKNFVGAGNGTRTRDPRLGKAMLYQLSYSRLFHNDKEQTIVYRMFL